MRVLELASVLAGPSAGQFFAELGAEVIKIENVTTRGDVTRSWKSAGEQTDDRSAYFCAANWGKRSIAIDLTTGKGQEIVRELALKSHMVIASYKPGDAERFNVDYRTLSGSNPGLIYGQVTGYGADNPRVGYDAIIQAESGFMSMNGQPSGPSLKMPVALVDVLAAHHLKEGLLLAMLEKSLTGKGRLVEVSLIQAAVSSLVNQASNWLVANVLPQKQGSSHPNIAPYGEVFFTADGKEIMLAVGTDHQFDALCQVLGDPALAGDSRFQTNQARVRHRAELKKKLEQHFSTRDSDYLVGLLHQSRVPAGVITNVKDAVNAAESRELLLDSDGLRGIRSFVGYPAASSHLLPPPHYGQHSAEILREILNFPPEYIDGLRTNRVIA